VNKISKHLPEIRIKYAWLLTQQVAEPMLAYYDPDSKLRERKEYEAIAAQYEKWWMPHEQRILEAMHEVTGLTFKQNVIDVHVAPFFYAFSSPLVIGVQFQSQQKLVSTLTHELVHRLLMDNVSHDDSNTIDEWTQLFGERDFVELVHIPVHSVMHEVFIDKLSEPLFLKSEGLEHASYRNSWKYVEEQGYQAINKKLRNLYLP